MAQSPDAAPVAVAPVPADGLIPALTPVKLTLSQDVGSKISTSGQPFAFFLAEPIVLDGHEVVPAGTPGVGEVIHAKKGGMSGSSGELVLAARYLQVGDRKLRLRSLKVAEAGKDSIGTAMAVGAVAGPIGFLIKGKEIDLPEGSTVVAKTAEDFALPAAAGAAAPASPPSN